MMIVLDSMIILLLVASIRYCWKLNQRIRELHRAQGDMITLIRQFDEAILRAQTGTEALKQEALRACGELQHTVLEAERLSDDLAYITRKGEEVADKLTEAITASRQPQKHYNPATEAALKRPSSLSFFNNTAGTLEPTVSPKTKAEKISTIESLLKRISSSRQPEEKQIADKKNTLPPSKWDYQTTAEAKKNFIKSLRTVQSSNV